MRMEGIQGPLKIHCFLDLAGRIEQVPLEEALRRTLSEVPLLRTRIREGTWRLRREGIPSSQIDVSALIQWCDSLDPAASQRFVRAPMEVTSGPPLALLVQTSDETTRLVLAVHHSVADAIGGFLLLDRLARHYSAITRNEPHPDLPPEPDTRSYLSYLKRLRLIDRFRVVARGADIVNEAIDAARGRVMATFNDRQLPSRGHTDWRTAELPRSRFGQLKELARERGGTLNDLLLTTFLLAACRIWPQPPDRTIMIQLPVNLRSDLGGIANQVGDLAVRVQNADRPDPHRYWQEVTRTTSKARDGLSAIARTFERAAISVAPPPLFRRLLGGYMDRPQNCCLSLVFSNLGALDPVPADFGSATIIRGYTLGPLSSPPGLAVWVTTLRDRLVFCLGFLDPVVSPENADRLLAAWLDELGDGRFRTSAEVSETRGRH